MRWRGGLSSVRVEPWGGGPGIRKRISAHVRSNVIAYLALFVALGGTSAYAANTIGSDDVVNDSLMSEDVQNGTLTRSDLAPSTLTGTYVLDDSLSFHDLALGTIVNSRLADNGVNSAKVAPDSLNGSDVDESTLTNARVSKEAAQTGPPVSSGAQFTQTAIPLGDGAWTQRAGEYVQVAGQATVVTPPTCDLIAGLFPGFGFVSVLSEGRVVASAAVPPGGGTHTVYFDSFPLRGPDADSAQTLTASISDQCTGGDDYTASDLKINVVGIR